MLCLWSFKGYICQWLSMWSLKGYIANGCLCDLWRDTFANGCLCDFWRHTFVNGCLCDLWRDTFVNGCLCDLWRDTFVNGCLYDLCRVHLSMWSLNFFQLFSILLLMYSFRNMSVNLDNSRFIHSQTSFCSYILILGSFLSWLGLTLYITIGISWSDIQAAVFIYCTIEGLFVHNSYESTTSGGTSWMLL